MLTGKITVTDEFLASKILGFLLIGGAVSTGISLYLSSYSEMHRDQFIDEESFRKEGNGKGDEGYRTSNNIYYSNINSNDNNSTSNSNNNYNNSHNNNEKQSSAMMHIVTADDSEGNDFPPDFRVIIHGGAGVVSKGIDSKPFFDSLSRIMTDAYKYAKKEGNTITGM